MKINLHDMCNEVCTDVAIATIFSISRSVLGFPFPNAINNDEDANKVLHKVNSSFEQLKDRDEYRNIDFGSLDLLTRKILEESSIIPSRFEERPKKALIVGDMNSIAILVNFNNHITIRSRSVGCAVKEEYIKAFELEEHFASSIPFVFDRELGYIVRDVSYFGTALFQSVFLSIPGIVMMGRLKTVIQDLKNNGLNANGYYSAHSITSMGWVYYIYNETSLGYSENEQILKFTTTVLKLIYLERDMRIQLYLKNKIKMADMIARALAVAKNAKLLDTEEAIDIVFKIKMGIELDRISGVSHEACNDAFYKVQVAHVIYSLLNDNFKGVSDELIKIERAKLLNNFSKKIEFI